MIAVPGQHITAGDFNALAQAILTKTAYANVHTVAFPAGEIRGQARRDDDEDHHDRSPRRITLRALEGAAALAPAQRRIIQ